MRVHFDSTDPKQLRLAAAAPRLLQWLQVVLDQVDYTADACAPTEMVAAVLSTDVIKEARAAIAKATA
jgi:hypothetical protein